MIQSQSLNPVVQVTPAQVNVLGSAPLTSLKSLCQQLCVSEDAESEIPSASLAKLFDTDFSEFLKATQDCLQMSSWMKALVSPLSQSQQNASAAYDRLLKNLSAAHKRVSEKSALLAQQLVIASECTPALEGAIRVGERAIRAATSALQKSRSSELLTLKSLIEARVTTLNTALAASKGVRRLLQEESCVCLRQLQGIQDIQAHLAALFADLTLARFCKSPEGHTPADTEALLFITETRVYKQLRELHSQLQLEQVLRTQAEDYFRAIHQHCAN